DDAADDAGDYTRGRRHARRERYAHAQRQRDEEDDDGGEEIAAEGFGRVGGGGHNAPCQLDQGSRWQTHPRNDDRKCATPQQRWTIAATSCPGKPAPVRQRGGFAAPDARVAADYAFGQLSSKPPRNRNRPQIKG